MWNCPTCGRSFQKTNQPHSCKHVPLEAHFVHKEQAKLLFTHLVEHITKHIGKVKSISLPCCIHLFGTYDFLAALPKKNALEIRFSLQENLHNARFINKVPLSATTYKYCIEITQPQDIDAELTRWLQEAYNKIESFRFQ